MDKTKADKKLAGQKEKATLGNTALKGDELTMKAKVRPAVPPRNFPAKKPIPKPRKKDNEGKDSPQDIVLQETIKTPEKVTIRIYQEIFLSEFRVIEQILAAEHVSLNIKDDSQLVMKGTAKGLECIPELISQLITTKTNCQEKVFTGRKSQLILSGKGARAMKKIEQTHNVVIEVESMQETEDNVEEDAWKKIGFTFDQRNFKTKEGIAVSWKYGNIANEKADILVNSAVSDLNQPTACGQALIQVGGKLFVQACKEHSNILMGDIRCTTGGDLNCKHVIHAVCCNWDRNNEEKSKTILSNLLQTILLKCDQLNATSLAMPTLGTGKHKFPDNVLSEIIEKQVTQFSRNKPSTWLKDIRIIVLDPKSPQQSREKATPLFSSKEKEVVFKQVRVSLHNGNLTEQPVDAILNILPYDMQLSSGGEVCKSIWTAGGDIIQTQVNSYGKPRPGSVIATSAGRMDTTQLILHFLPKENNVKSLQDSVEQCLEAAKSRSLHSVAVSAVGKGYVNISPQKSAELTLSAVRIFSFSEYPLSVNVVVPDKSLFKAFESVFDKESESCEGNPSKSNPFKRFLSGTDIDTQESKLDKNNSPVSSGSPFMPRSTQFTSKTALHIYARWQNDIDKVLRKVAKFIEFHLITKEMECTRLSDMLYSHWQDVENMASQHEVTVTCKSPTLATIEGGHKGVMECKDNLSRLLKADDTGTFLPSHWDLHAPGQLVHRVSLSPTSPEYQQVLDQFTATGGASNTIIDIERIQNPDLYKAYHVKKQMMKGEENEMQLFHGVTEENVMFINANNFNRIYGGMNETINGDGVYFARDASYALQFSQPGRKGRCYMYLAKVLVGKYISGTKEMKFPPPRDEQNHPVGQYDSAVDNDQNPSIFVIFTDHQYYPEYLIAFTK